MAPKSTKKPGSGSAGRAPFAAAAENEVDGFCGGMSPLVCTVTTAALPDLRSGRLTPKGSGPAGAPGPQDDQPRLIALEVSPREQVLLAPDDELTVDVDVFERDAALALAACSDRPQMVSADAPPPAATAAVTEMVDKAAYAPQPVAGRTAAEAPPSTLSDF